MVGFLVMGVDRRKSSLADLGAATRAPAPGGQG
jgi:hypothetical protein